MALSHESQKYLMNYRKKKRDLPELRKAHERIKNLKNPDTKLLKAIVDDIAAIEKELHQ